MPQEATAAASADKVSFTREGKFLNNQAAVKLQVEFPRNSKFAQCLFQNSPFPPEDILLGQIRVGTELAEIKFGDGEGSVSFKAGGGVNSGIGVYKTTEGFKKDFDPANRLLGGISLPETGLTRLVAMQWGYAMHAAAKGSLALGYGTSIKFGADGSAEGAFLILRAFPEEPNARDALQALFSSWMLPRQIESINQLEPGTWLIAEVDGELGLQLGAQFGYNFNWIRNVGVSGLSGDIGMRIQLGVNATLGFQASGKYLLIVARESTRQEDKIVRFRLHKLNTKGWTFALNAGVNVKGETGKFLPRQQDDFIAGVFGVYGSQIVEDLKKFREWTNPAVPLERKLAGFASHYAVSQVKNLAGDQIRQFEEGRKQIAKFLSGWDQLDQKVSSLLWNLLRDGGPSAQLFEESLRALAASDDEGIRKLIQRGLSEVAFFQTPLGMWLENAVTGSVLGAANNSAEWKNIRTVAAQTLNVMEGSVLRELIRYVDEKLHVDQIRRAVDMARFENLEPWLQDKLEKFLGEKVNLEGLKEIQKTLHLLDEHAQQFYAAAHQALNSTYGAAFTRTYAESTTRDALVDASFDFSQDPGLSPFLRSAIQGNLNDLLLTNRPGVTLNAATLTHGIRRQNHIELNLPYFKTSLDQLNNALAKLEVMNEDGRLFVYSFKANDLERAGQKWQGALSVSGQIYLSAATGVRSFAGNQLPGEGMQWQYSFRQCCSKLRSVQLEERLRPLVPEYFKRSFGGPLAPDKASLAEWVADLDAHSEEIMMNGRGNIGSTLLSLEVSLPGKCLAAWLKAPLCGKQGPRPKPYLEMSRSIQKVLRRLISYCYFDDPEKYIDDASGRAANVLVYQCLPVTTAVRRSESGWELNQENDIFWEYDDPRPANDNERYAMIFSNRTEDNLQREMARIQRVMEDTEGMRGWAEDYRVEALPAKRAHAWGNGARTFLVSQLLWTESTVIHHALEAGTAMAEFTSKGMSNPEEALEALARFGRKITETFHTSLNSIFGGTTLKQLGSLVFLEAARALDADLAMIEPAARLEVLVVRPTDKDTWNQLKSDFLEGKPIPGERIALQQPVVSLPA